MRTTVNLNARSYGLSRPARIISILFNPLVIGVPAVLAIGIKDRGGIELEVIPAALLAIIIMCIIPLLYIRFLLKRGVVENFHISDRRQRIYLFPVLLACFLLASWILYRTEGVSRLVVALLAYGFLNCLLCALISFRFKISLHCAGLSGLLVGAVYAFGTAAMVPGAVVLVLTGWSRVRLGEHSPVEVTAGSIFGILVMTAEMVATFGPPWAR